MKLLPETPNESETWSSNSTTRCEVVNEEAAEAFADCSPHAGAPSLRPKPKMDADQSFATLPSLPYCEALPPPP